MATKNAVQKTWSITPSSDGKRWSAWPAGDKPSGSSLPAYMSGKPLFEWFSVSGTAFVGGMAAQFYSAVTVSGSKLYSALNGGHNNSGNNGFFEIDVGVDAPAWSTRRAGYGSPVQNTDYYTTTEPTSRHTYNTPQVLGNSIWFLGCKSAYGNLANDYAHVDRLDISAGTYDAANTWPDMLGAAAGIGTCVRTSTDEIWSVAGTSVWKWTQAGGQVALKTDYDGLTEMARVCRWDPVADRLVTIGWGDGYGDNKNTLNAWSVANDGLSRFQIVFNSSSALTAYQSEKPFEAGLEYNPFSDTFWIYTCNASDTKRIYVVTPNRSGGNWDISFLSLGSGTATPSSLTDGGGGGVFGRARIVPAIKAFVFAQPSALWVMRIAT